MLFFFGDSLIRASMKVASYHWKQIHIHMQKKNHNKFSFTFCLPCPLWKLILRAVHKVSEIEFTAIKACADYEWWNIIYKLCASWKIFLICNLKYGKQLRKKITFWLYCARVSIKGCENALINTLCYESMGSRSDYK